jgi:RNA polymerase sigma-70 factor, ECF subfamily
MHARASDHRRTTKQLRAGHPHRLHRDEALRIGRIGSYQLQAATAAVHAEAGTAAETDWAQIAALYDKLAQINPTPVVLLNGAVAVGMRDGPRRGLP